MQTLLITADALRADHLGQYGYDRDTMPALDRLVERGQLYENAYANAAHTQLSVPSFLCSRYNALEAVKEGPTVASELQNEGIATAGFHSNLVLSEDIGTVTGFDTYRDYYKNGVTDDADAGRARTATEPVRAGLRSAGERALKTLRGLLGPYLGHIKAVRELYETIEPDRFFFEPTLYTHAEEVTDDVIEWVDAHADEPFFCWIHYMEPHRPYGYSPGNPMYHAEDLSEQAIFDLMAKAGSSPESVTESERRTMKNLYDSDIRYLSSQLRRLFDSLESHGLYYHRNRPYEELVRVPLIAKHPGNNRRTVKTPRPLLDVAPTILDRHDVAAPDSFLGQLLDADGQRSIVATSYREELSIGVRNVETPWKYISTESGSEELYDLRDDPDERTDLSGTNSDVSRRLHRQIPESVYPISADAENVGAEASEEVKENLSDLGYMQ
jgi:arylsulfatase A-like enzyme